MAPSFNPATPAGLKACEDYFLTRSYVTGHQASRDDLAVYVAFTGAPAAATYPHTARWYNHITALLGSSFPGKADGVSVAGGSSAAAPAAAAPAAGKPAPKPKNDDPDLDDEDDDLDLFGDLTPEEQAAKDAKDKAIAAAKARSAEKAKLSKSMIVLDVKPWDDETDMAKLEAYIRGITIDGLLWGASKLVPVGYGVKKMQITVIIEDEKVPSFDGVIEDFIVQDGENEYCQSADVQSFNKL